MKPIDITVTSGTQVVITIPDVYLTNKRVYELDFCLTKPAVIKYSKIVGNEVVYIQDGVGGTNYPLMDNAGNVFYACKLLLGRCYRLKFGNNGLPANVQHFINLNTPCENRAYDPANATVGTITPASVEDEG